MTRYIDADALKELFPDNGEGSWTYNVTVKACIDAQPTIDAVNVRHGKWIEHGVKEGHLIEKYTCSDCDYYSGTKTSNYCPNCGARMVNE